jgi:hypothetical protein
MNTAGWDLNLRDHKFIRVEFMSYPRERIDRRLLFIYERAQQMVGIQTVL